MWVWCLFDGNCGPAEEAKALEHIICDERKKYKSAHAANVTLSAAQKQSDAALDGIMHYVATGLSLMVVNNAGCCNCHLLC